MLDLPFLVKRTTEQMSKGLWRDLSLFLHPVHIDSEPKVLSTDENEKLMVSRVAHVASGKEDFHSQSMSIRSKSWQAHVKLVVDREDLSLRSGAREVISVLNPMMMLRSSSSNIPRSSKRLQKVSLVALVKIDVKTKIWVDYAAVLVAKVCSAWSMIPQASELMRKTLFGLLEFVDQIERSL